MAVSQTDFADRKQPSNGRAQGAYYRDIGGQAARMPAIRRFLRELHFRGHPEGFQPIGATALVNVPQDGAILRLDLDRNAVQARWPTGLHRLNFPMALAPDGRWCAVGYRFPSALARVDANTGRTLALQSTCGDTDDIFLVGERTLVVCGAGHVDIAGPRGAEARVETVHGARTDLYVPDLNALFVAVPAKDGAAAIWKMRFRTVTN